MFLLNLTELNKIPQSSNNFILLELGEGGCQVHGALYMEHSYKSAPDIKLVNNEHIDYVMRQRFLSEDTQFQLQGSEY
jgi:hypothetical protein